MVNIIFSAPPEYNQNVNVPIYEHTGPVNMQTNIISAFNNATAISRLCIYLLSLSFWLITAVSLHGVYKRAVK
jgi:hypothetical protein